MLDAEEQRALAVISCALGVAVARALWSLGPDGELYGGMIARTLEVGDRSDARISYNVVQLVAHGTHPFSATGAYYFIPYNFSSRGPLAGLASAPVVLMSGGKPPLMQPVEPWQPFDAQGYMAYRLAMMSFASVAFLGVWDLAQRLSGYAAARVALLLAVTTPFLVHEIWFTWPKLLAAYFVLLAGVHVIERRPLSAGLLVGVGYLIHPGALIGVSALALLALWPLSGAEWRRPNIKALALLLGGVAVGLVIWRFANGTNYDQSGFLDYFTSTGPDFSPSPLHWLAYRAASASNTFVPMLLPLAFPHYASINIVNGTSPFIIHFFFQYWNGLPFGAGIFFFPLLLLSLWRAFRRWPWGVFAVVIAPAIAFTIYWGSTYSGMLREGLQTWVLALFVVAALQQGAASFNWFRSGWVKAILVLRIGELLLIAIGPTLFTTGVLVSPVYSINDVVALTGMVGFAALLAVLVWRTTPASLARAGG